MLVARQCRCVTTTMTRCAARSSPHRSFSSSWMSPHQRKRRVPLLGQRHHHRPLVNGQRVAFHVNELTTTTTNHNSVHHASINHDSQKRSYASDLVVFLDMDECLLHSRFLDDPQQQSSSSSYAHQYMPHHRNRNPGDTSTKNDDSYRIQLGPRDRVQVSLRPGVRDFVHACAARYETHIFTAALSVYANPVLDALLGTEEGGGSSTKDPNSHGLAGRWYREHCTYQKILGQPAYVKDFTKLPIRSNRNDCYASLNLDRCVLVDNNPLSFAATPDNGVWVESFYDDPTDDALPQVTQLLRELEDVSDVRTVLGPRYGLREVLRQEAVGATAPAHSLTKPPRSVAVA